MVAVKANFKFQLKFDVVIHEHYLLQVFEDHGCLFLNSQKTAAEYITIFILVFQLQEISILENFVHS